jgi:hypothetical protein
MSLRSSLAGQAGHDVRVVEGESTISGKLKTETLSDMDAKVTTLAGKLSKARRVKAGMMSVLLTPPSAAGQAGRVRLV